MISSTHPRVLIIAPHSYCEATTYRDCDTVARLAVSELHKADTFGLIVHEHLSDRLRALGDYNRPVTDEDKWRVEARTTASSLRPDLVLEVHSFPGQHSTFAQAWPGADLVLFRSLANAQWIGQVAEAVQTKVRDLKVMVADPWHPCAISDDMAALGLPHVLVEFNEDMPRANVGPLAEAVLYAIAQLSAARVGVSGGQKRRWRPTWAMAALILLVVVLIVVFNRGPLAARADVGPAGGRICIPLRHDWPSSRQ